MCDTVPASGFSRELKKTYSGKRSDTAVCVCDTVPAWEVKKNRGKGSDTAVYLTLCLLLGDDEALQWQG